MDLGSREKYIKGRASEEAEVGAVGALLSFAKEEKVYERGLRYRVTDGGTCRREGESKMRQRHER